MLLYNFPVSKGTCDTSSVKTIIRETPSLNDVTSHHG